MNLEEFCSYITYNTTKKVDLLYLNLESLKKKDKYILNQYKNVSLRKQVLTNARWYKPKNNKTSRKDRRLK